MSNLKKLIEEKIQWIIRDFSYKAPEQVTKDFVSERYIPILKELLALMDEAEQKPSITPYKMPTFEKKPGWDLGAVGGQSSDCVPPPKEVMPSEAVRTTVQNSAVTGAHRAVETSEDPFQGPHWDGPRVVGADGVYNDIAAYKRDCNLRDELRRMRGGE